MLTPPVLGLVTCAEWPALYEDDHLLQAALARRGLPSVPVVWTAPGEDAGGCTLWLLRSCWDYVHHLDRFVSWVRASPHLENRPETVLWNLDKRYLLELADRGVPIVPTRLLPAGRAVDLAALRAETGWGALILKPAISLGALRTRLVADGEGAEAQVWLAEQLQGADMLAQPFLPEIREAGEVSLFFFGGVFSHAVCKRPAPGDFRVQTQYGGEAAAIQPGAALVTQAERVLKASGRAPIYARVDGVVRGGVLLLMELELIEPYLFLSLCPGAADAFAAVLAARVATPGPIRAIQVA